MSRGPAGQDRVGLHAVFFLVTALVAFGGGVAVLAVSHRTGLSTPPTIGQLGLGTPQGLTMLFVLLWSGFLHALSINDGRTYHLRIAGSRVGRSRVSEVVIPIVAALVAAAWGAFGLRPSAAAQAARRAVEDGLDVGALERGVVEVTALYGVVVAATWGLLLVVRWCSPVDLDAYEERLRRTMRVRTPDDRG